MFINETLEKAIEDYISIKGKKNLVKANSFFVIFIKVLVEIYDELDILNPFYMKSDDLLYRNISKYGYPRTQIKELFEILDNYNKNENHEDFIFIEKSLVDMICKKNESISVLNEMDSYYKLLYSSKCNNFYMISYNYKINNNSDNIIDYLEEELIKHEKKNNHKDDKKLLSFDAYKAFNYTQEDIDNMQAEEIASLNNQIYSYFNINKNAINKDYLLSEKISSIINPKKELTTGNGYVDILYILAIIATLGLLVVLITIFVL